MWVQSLGLEDPLEEGTATHSSILAWRIPWTEEPGTVHRITKSRTRVTRLSTQTRVLCFRPPCVGGEGGLEWSSC